jgi:hypothetical protein
VGAALSGEGCPESALDIYAKLEALVDADLDTLATALYVTTGDLLIAHPERVPPRPRVGITPKTSDAEMLTLAVMQALLGFTSETRWLRYARLNLLEMFPHLPSNRATTSAYANSLRRWPGWSTPWDSRPASPAMTCGSWTPPRWSAPAPGRP